MRRPNPTRYYSHSWEYPGYYEGYECHDPEYDGAFCIMPPVEGDQCGSNYYAYIHFCKGYPFDLMNLDKCIDMMANPETTFYNLMENC